MAPSLNNPIVPSGSPHSVEHAPLRGTPSTVNTVTSPGHTGQASSFGRTYPMSSVTSNTSPYRSDETGDKASFIS